MGAAQSKAPRCPVLVYPDRDARQIHVGLDRQRIEPCREEVAAVQLEPDPTGTIRFDPALANPERVGQAFAGVLDVPWCEPGREADP